MTNNAPEPYGGSPQARRGVMCECCHTPSYHEGDEYGFCLVCDCNYYRPTIRSGGSE